MKKVKFDKDQRLYWGEFFQLLLCPLSNTDKVEVVCGPWCAWFDIEEKCVDKISPDGKCYFGSETTRVITCKGTPIGELVEEEVGG